MYSHYCIENSIRILSQFLANNYISLGKFKRIIYIHTYIHNKGSSYIHLYT